MPTPRRDGRLLALLFALAFGLRAAYSLALPADVQLHDIDARGYHQLALNLLAGHGFSLDSQPPYRADAIRTPAYPLFVAAVYALTGPVPRHVALVQAALDALTAVLLALIVLRLTGKHWPAYLAAALYALNPAALRFNNELLTETMLATVLTALVALLILSPPTRRTLFALGLLTALALLIKPNLILLPVLLVPVLLLTRPRPPLTALAAYGLALALLLAPWLIRNRLTFDEWLFSAAFDNNLHRVSAVATMVRVRGEAIAPWSPAWEAIHGGLVAQAEQRYGWVGPAQTGRDLLTREQQLANLARETLRQHPRAFLESHLLGFLRGWLPQEHRYWYEVASGQPWDALNPVEGALGLALDRARVDGPLAGVAFFWQARFGSLPPLALALWLGWLLAYAISAALILRALWLWLPHRPVLVLFLLALIGYVTFLPGPISYIRFRLPVQPLLILLVTLGLLRRAHRTHPSTPAAT